jgi:hypothetical protein
MNKKFLDKVVNQIMRETEMVFPTSDELGYINFPFSKLYYNHDNLIKKNWTIEELDGYFSGTPSFLFERHLEEIYGIHKWDSYDEFHYLWDAYVEVFMNKLKSGINIVDSPDYNIPQRIVGDPPETPQLDESFKKEDGISFLIKVVDQLIGETEIEMLGGLKTARSTWSNISHLGSAFWDRLRKHCRSVYGLNTDELLWVEDNYRERLDSKLRNNLSESKEINLKDSKFLQKVLKYLIDNTKMGRHKKLPEIPFFHYDGYIIVPIGSGFRFDIYNKTRQPNGDFIGEWWGEMKEVYSLKDEEVSFLLDEYNNFFWKMVEKINSEEDIKGEINESKMSDKDFLDKLLDHIKSETKFKEKSKFMHSSGRTIYAGNYVQLPFFPEDWYRGVRVSGGWELKDFTHWVHTTLGVNDPTEIEYLWKRYSEWVNKKCNE